MKKLFLDTNIIIDLLAKREPFYLAAATLFSLADINKVSLHVSALSYANTNYILQQSLKQAEVKLILRKLNLLVNICSLNEKIIELSLNDNDFNDFEDALQHYSAIENNMDFIITRNLKDFQKSKIPAMTVDQYLGLD
jgi:predicted nucleic acid-binding protein